jgi:hypothetical protein
MDNKILGRSRRSIIATSAAAGVGLFVLADPNTTEAVQVGGSNGIRPFRSNFSEAEVQDLRRRVRTARLPERETVADFSQGVPLATVQNLQRYWANDYDWRRAEANLNRFPQFITEIDGLDIHFIHVRSRHPNALPVIVTHGWPGSILEQIKLIEPLTDPTAHGGRASDIQRCGDAGRPLRGRRTRVRPTQVVLHQRLLRLLDVDAPANWGRVFGLPSWARDVLVRSRPQEHRTLRTCLRRRARRPDAR